MPSTMKKRSGTVCRKKMHAGKRGGVYYIRKGKKVYLPLASCPKSVVTKALAAKKSRSSTKKRSTKRRTGSKRRATTKRGSRYVRIAHPVIAVIGGQKRKVRLYRKKGKAGLYRRVKSKATGKYRYSKVTGRQLKLWKKKALKMRKGKSRKGKSRKGKSRKGKSRK